MNKLLEANKYRIFAHKHNQMKREVTRLKLSFRLIVLPLLIMTVLRVIFYFTNSSFFSHVKGFDFLYGTWYDLVTIGLVFLPFFVIFLLPITWNSVLKWISIPAYVISFLIVLVPNIADIEYFKYTGKRSTGDVLSVFNTAAETKHLLATFFVDFWYYFVLVIVSLYFGIRYLNRVFSRIKEEKGRYVIKSSYWIAFVFLLIIIGRGGFGFKPVTVIDIAKHTSISNVGLVNNSTFSIVKTYGKSDLSEEKYFASIEETEKYFNPIKETVPANIMKGRPNVVVIILESFGKEFIGYYNGQKTFTPFLDSLLEQSLTFEHGFANGKKSIEAVPSIFGSIPSLMETPYIVSTYGSNEVMGLPEILSKYGYHTAFFHGATNGSMRFDTFSQLLGFKEYYGRTEYGNEAHADATWGILDEYFNPWMAKKLSSFKEPFFSGLFTLSSHHPFFIPEHRKNEVIKGEQPIATSISYADLSLRLFFNEAKKYKYFNNTIFLIMADHSPATTTAYYNERDQIFQIPFAIYTPNGSIKPERSLKNMQQLDVLPTVLELSNIKRKVYAFGQSVFQKQESFGISYLSNAFYLWNNNRILEFSGNTARNLYQLEPNVTVEKEATFPTQIDLENVLRAMIQRYNSDLIKNQTRVN